MTDLARRPPFAPGEIFPFADKLSQMTQGTSPETPHSLAAQSPGDFTARWAEVQLPVRAYLNSFLSDRSAVDDCIQEVALLAWKKGPAGEEPSSAFLGFCIACAKRVAMGEIRKKYRNRLRHLDPETVTTLADTVAALEHQDPTSPTERISALRSCLDRLDPEPRRLLELRYSAKPAAALKHEARATGRSMDAIYKKLERLRTLLRDCVAAKSSREP